MKRVLLFLLAAALLCCGGCRGSIYANYRDAAKLRPVQTLGFDSDGDAVTVSVSAGEGRQQDAPIALSRQGSSIETALAGLQNAFPEAQPYFAHIQYFIIGRSAAEAGMERWLEWMARNPEIRLDATMFISREQAAPMILQSVTETAGITEAIQSLELELKDLGEGYPFSVRALCSSLAERGGAICGAIRYDPEAAENNSVISPAGFAVFSDGRLSAFIEEQNAPAVLLFLQKAQGARIPLNIGSEPSATAILDSGSTSVYVSGSTAQVRCSLGCSLLEGDADTEALERTLAEALQKQLAEVISLEQTLDCDFLGLCPGLSPAALRWEISVDARLDKSYDLRQEESEA